MNDSSHRKVDIIDNVYGRIQQGYGRTFSKNDLKLRPTLNLPVQI